MKRLHYLVLILLCIDWAACQKIPNTDQLNNRFVVITNRDKNADFGSKKTYFVSDTVTYISNVSATDSILTGAGAQSMVGAVKDNMNGRGYQFVDRTSHPDIGIKITAIKQVNAGVIYPPGWWWGYPGYPGGCYWGWCGYPPYYGYPVAYSYQVGDVILEMLDLKDANENHNLTIIWSADAGGVLGSTSQTNINLAVEGINQAYAQSPYILSH